MKLSNSKTDYSDSVKALPGAVFLDRDGTINLDTGYISNPDDFELFPFASEAILALNKMGYLVFIVTNQSGIARQYYTIDDLNSIHDKMINSLQKNGGHVDGIYFSPYHIKGTLEPYNIQHEDRKPGLGMFKKALQEHEFQINGSFMIGDKYSDIAFGKKAGLITILVLSGEGKTEFYENRQNWEYKPDFIVKDLLSAVKLISQMRE